MVDRPSGEGAATRGRSSRRSFLGKVGLSVFAAVPAARALASPAAALAVPCCQDVVCSKTGYVFCDGGNNLYCQYQCNDAHGCGWCYDLRYSGPFRTTRGDVRGTTTLRTFLQHWSSRSEPVLRGGRVVEYNVRVGAAVFAFGPAKKLEAVRLRDSSASVPFCVSLSRCTGT